MTLDLPSSDFTNSALADIGKSVTWYNAIKTKNNITGVETLTYDAGVPKTVVIRKRSQRYAMTQEGIVDLGDAVVLSPIALGFAKDDKLTWDGQTYLIMNVVRRNATEDMFDTCTLIKIE